MNTRSFFASLCQKLFYWRTNREILERIFPHLRNETDFGYAFQSSQQMNAETERLDAQALLDAVEKQADKLPRAYGEAFRYVMHRDLHARLTQYARLAKRRTQPTWCDPGLVATRFTG